MDIVDILTLANAGYTAEQISAMSAQQAQQAQPAPFPAQQTVQQVQPQVVPQMAQPQAMPQMAQPQEMPQTVQPLVQSWMVNPYRAPLMGQLTPAPMPPAPTVPATQPAQAAQQTPSETGTTQTTPLVPGNPTAEQLAGQLAQAQATNLNGINITPTPKVSVETRLAEHYTSLMGGKTEKEGGK